MALLVKSGANVNMKDKVSTVYSAAMIILFVYFMHSYNIVRICVSDVISEAIVVDCNYEAIQVHYKYCCCCCCCC